MTDSYNVTADELRQFIERVEQLEAEKRDIADQIKEVMAEAKGRGYSTPVMREVEREAVLQMYANALGMS